MKELFSSQVLQEVELAIREKNYNRMYTLGEKLVKQSSNDNAWLEAAVVIAGYLAKNPEQIWRAVDLSKSAALAAPERSRIQEITINSLKICINTLPKAKDRIDAAYSVVSAAPKRGMLMTICLEIMVDNVPELDNPAVQQHYLKIVIQCAPDGNIMSVRAKTMMKEANQNRLQPKSSRSAEAEAAKRRAEEMFEDTKK